MSYAGMRRSEGAGVKKATRAAEAVRDNTGLRNRNEPRIRRDDNGATSTRAVMVSSLFFILLATSFLFGGHAAIDPLLRSVIAARDGAATGDFVSAMPDGKFCRRMSFDNATSEIIEGSIERCPDNMVETSSRNTGRGFAWGEH
jgi:hypothetical protein